MDRHLRVEPTDAGVLVTLPDGQAVEFSTERLRRATTEQKLEVRVIGQMSGLHWPLIDEDIRLALKRAAITGG